MTTKKQFEPIQSWRHFLIRALTGYVTIMEFNRLHEELVLHEELSALRMRTTAPL
jgi:hypothetical protein